MKVIRRHPVDICRMRRHSWFILTRRKGTTMVRVSRVCIMVAIVILLTALSNAQPIGPNQSGERAEPISWEMYRQRQIETQLETQRQQLELQRQRLELQAQQLDLQRQQLEILQQQYQMELEKRRIEQQKKKNRAGVDGAEE